MESVLEALADALQLDEAERAHLFDLARAASATPRTRRRTAQQRIRPSVQRILMRSPTLRRIPQRPAESILGANRLGYALYLKYDDPARPVNMPIRLP